jgi:Ion channel regulatory protein UNC-93
MFLWHTCRNTLIHVMSHTKSDFPPLQHIQSRGFCIAAGALLGIGAQMFWICQGSIMISYPVEAEKGKAIAIFWVIL